METLWGWFGNIADERRKITFPGNIYVNEVAELFKGVIHYYINFFICRLSTIKKKKKMEIILILLYHGTYSGFLKIVLKCPSLEKLCNVIK